MSTCYNNTISNNFVSMNNELGELKPHGMASRTLVREMTFS